MSSPESPSPSPEALRERWLAEVNAKIESLGQRGDLVRLPESHPDFEALRGKTILMIDDLKELLAGFLPTLVVATEGHGDIIRHDQQTVEELAVEIAARNPDILLLDNTLRVGVRGPSVAKQLRSQSWTGKIIGFSADPSTENDFADGGADGFVEKIGSPMTAVRQVRLIIRDLLGPKK